MIGTFNTFLGFPLCLKMIAKTSQGYSTMLAFFWQDIKSIDSQEGSDPFKNIIEEKGEFG